MVGLGLKVKGHVVGLGSRVNFGDRVKGEGSRGWVRVKGEGSCGWVGVKGHLWDRG